MRPLLVGLFILVFIVTSLVFYPIFVMNSLGIQILLHVKVRVMVWVVVEVRLRPTTLLLRARPPLRLLPLWLFISFRLNNERP